MLNLLLQFTNDNILKFYEKKDLIKPMKDDENGYRRYSDYDVCDVMTTNFYRQLDIEIKKI